MSKPWRLSASVAVLAPRHAVPNSRLPGLRSKPGTNDAGDLDCHDYKICFVKRAGRSTFMPDAMVFPGGAVDPEDYHTASALFPSQDRLDLAVRCAAVRETFEESGVSIFDPMLPDPRSQSSSAWRGRVHDDAGALRGLCSEYDTMPWVDSLHPWCTFITPDFEHQRLKKGGFDARFFVWCATDAGKEAGSGTEGGGKEGRQRREGDEASIASMLEAALADNQETVALEWFTPFEALAAVEDGLVRMAPPQW